MLRACSGAAPAARTARPAWKTTTAALPPGRAATDASQLVLAQRVHDTLGIRHPDALVDRECLAQPGGRFGRVPAQQAAADALQRPGFLRWCAQLPGDR